MLMGIALVTDGFRSEKYMAKTLSEWVKTFSDCEIPVLHESKLRIHILQEDEQDITVSVLADIARQDPGFAISLLRHAGRNGKKEITTLSHAISLISIPLVIKMLTDLPELEKVIAKKYISIILGIYAYQHQIACMAKEWSILRKESENHELFTAGLNRGFFSFMLYLIEPVMAKQIETIYFADSKNYLAKEKELLGYNVDEISEAIAKSWKLPELIRESYSGKHHNPKITGIRLAAELMHEIHSHYSIQYQEELLQRVAEYMRVPTKSAPGKLNSTLIKTIRHSQQYLPYQPLLSIIMSYPASIKKTPEKIIVEKEVAENTIFADAIKLLQAKNPNVSVRELIEITIQALKEGIGFSRAIFMGYDKNEQSLSVKLQAVDRGLPDFKNLQISLKLNKLFNPLLKKEQILCINSINQHKFIPLLPEKLRPLKPIATIIISSFYVNGKATGCFYVDYGANDKQLSAKDLKLFKIICNELKAAIELALSKRSPVKKVA